MNLLLFLSKNCPVIITNPPRLFFYNFIFHSPPIIYYAFSHPLFNYVPLMKPLFVHVMNPQCLRQSKIIIWVTSKRDKKLKVEA